MGLALGGTSRAAQEMHHEEDVWSMDWSNWRSFESALPAVAAA